MAMVEGGLVSAFRLSEPVAQLGWNDVDRASSGEPVWLHLDRSDEHARDWLHGKSGLDAVVVDALLAEETRPRAARFGDGMLVILRGVNLNPGAEPDDMVALRIWIDAGRIISIRARRLLAAQDVRDELEKDRKPSTTAELFVRMVSKLVARMAPVIDGLSDALDEFEERTIGGPARQLREDLGGLRRTAIGLRRYLAPQRDVLAGLVIDTSDGLDERSRLRLRESVDAMVRYVEELDALRERATVIGEEMASLLAERMNRTMYVLSMVGTVFLPLGFVTGLLGVNVGGIPGAETPFAFGLLVTALLVVGIVEVMLFRRWRLI